MEIKGRKVVAFISCMLIFVGLYILTIKVAPTVLEGTMGIVFLILIFANATVFISFNTLDKWLKAKWFKPELSNTISNTSEIVIDKVENVVNKIDAKKSKSNTKELG